MLLAVAESMTWLLRADFDRFCQMSGCGVTSARFRAENGWFGEDALNAAMKVLDLEFL